MKASGGSASSTLILDIPPYVLEELCSSMDCLSDWEWMRFASRVISNQTDLIRIHRMERMGVSVTRELLWYWEQRMATVQDLVTILQDLELYRAINILQQCFPISARESSVKERVGPRPAWAPSSKMGPPDATTPESPVQPLPSPPAVPQSLLNSFQGSCSQEALSIPQQERGGYVSSSPLLWTMEEVEQVTGQFSSTRVIHRGEFADVFRAQKENRLYAIKKLKKHIKCSP
ncbi:interleukin-1 receptor-associated kinase-like 2 [Discoglossus pictus]